LANQKLWPLTDQPYRVQRKVCLFVTAGGCRKNNFWTTRVTSIKNYIFGILTSRAINWYIYESNPGGGGGPMWLIFLGGFSSGPLPRNFKHIGIRSSSPVDCHPFLANWVKGGGSVDMSKSQRHMRSGAGCGVSQANGAAIHSKLPGLCQHEIVSGTLKKGSNVELCKPVMGAW
jgi:hypothetical protein